MVFDSWKILKIDSSLATVRFEPLAIPTVRFQKIKTVPKKASIFEAFFISVISYFKLGSLSQCYIAGILTTTLYFS